MSVSSADHRQPDLTAHGDDRVGAVVRQHRFEEDVVDQSAGSAEQRPALCDEPRILEPVGGVDVAEDGSGQVVAESGRRQVVAHVAPQVLMRSAIRAATSGGTPPYTRHRPRLVGTRPDVSTAARP